MVDAVAHEATCAWRSTSSSNLDSHTIDMRLLYHVWLNPGSLMHPYAMSTYGQALPSSPETR